MSKSLGNFEPLSDLLARHDPQAIRLLFLADRLPQSDELHRRVDRRVVCDARPRLKKTYRGVVRRARPRTRPDRCERVEAALDEDMNTSVALAAMLDSQCGPRQGRRVEELRMRVRCGCSASRRATTGYTSRSARCRRISSNASRRRSVTKFRSTARRQKKRSRAVVDARRVRALQRIGPPPTACATRSRPCGVEAERLQRRNDVDRRRRKPRAGAAPRPQRSTSTT